MNVFLDQLWWWFHSNPQGIDWKYVDFFSACRRFLWGHWLWHRCLHHRPHHRLHNFCLRQHRLHNLVRSDHWIFCIPRGHDLFLVQELLLLELRQLHQCFCWSIGIPLQVLQKDPVGHTISQKVDPPGNEEIHIPTVHGKLGKSSTRLNHTLSGDNCWKFNPENMPGPKRKGN